MTLRRVKRTMLDNFSPKQKKIFTWWASPDTTEKDGIICDGAVRSGKTVCMSLSFAIWACACFDGQNFGICGRTINSAKRNIVSLLLKNASELGFRCEECASKNYFDLHYGDNCNRFYSFGGKDEGSAPLIQGITLAGILMDETALMPRSFVEQAVARCSVTGSKLWFNCNPEGPFHWFKKEWIDKAEEKNLLYMHFELTDNPSLSEDVIKRYSRLYTGAFYQRFVLGKWSAVQGLVYPMFDESKHTTDSNPRCEKYVVSCDYGTVNPSSFGLWGKSGEKWYRLDEYYFDSAKEGRRKTDEEHYESLKRLIGTRKVETVVVDPSAASFIQCIERHGEFHVTAAKNDVVWGIRIVSDYINSGKILINSQCRDILREFTLYRWDESCGKDAPIKEFDHAMDDMRYFVTYISQQQEDCFMVMSLERGGI